MAQLLVEDPSADPVTPSGRLYVSPPREAGASQADPWAAFPDAPPKQQKGAAAPGAANAAPAAAPDAETPAAGGDPWAAFSDKPLPAGARGPAHEVGSGEAIGRGVLHGATMGLAPAVEGATAAANPDIEAAAKKFGIDPATAVSFLNHVAPGLKSAYGAGRVLFDNATSSDEAPTPAQAAYTKKREEEAQANAEASEQHPYLYGGADIAGSLAVPLPGFGAIKTGARVADRVARGVAGGMTAGGAFGAGNAIGEGKDVRHTMSDAADGVAAGGLFGGVLGGALGRRPASTGTAARAAQTAEDLGAPLPRGVASDSPMVRATTAKVKEVPFAGERVGEGVARTQEAAQGQIADMAENLAGGAPTRTTAAPGASRALQHVVEHNNNEIDHAYDALRGAINPDQHFPMPQLQQAIARIEQRRARAGWPNPAEGLQQARNVANGVGHAGGFNGVHRLRRDLREAGNPSKANPGYDAGDFRYLRRAVDADLRVGVRRVATDPATAESLFNTAELTAGQLIQINEQLEKLSGQKGESIVGALLNSTKEKTGNIQLLREMRRRMTPQAFDQIAGVMLHELGLAEGQVGEFSLSRFVTNWNKVSDEAKNLMFRPEHRRWIENIVGLGEHLKDANRFTNNSHTGSIIVMLDLAKDATLLSHDLWQSGSLGAGAAMGAGTTAGLWLLTHWLANPKSAASMSRWTDAYRALTLHQPTPARVAAFKIATRNVANNIHVPADRIMEAVSNQMTRAKAEPDEEQLTQDDAPRE